MTERRVSSIRLKFVLAICVVSIGIIGIVVGTLVTSTIALLLIIPVYFTVVCGKRSTTSEIVSSAKMAEEPIVEEWTPEVVKPKAELTELPIETIEGIGPVYGKKLRSAGVATVQDLLETTTDKIAEICDVSEEQAQHWVAMSRFCWLESVSEEDAEAIVYAAGITTLHELAAADPEHMLNEIKEAVELGHVQVPAGYTFTLEMVKKWIEEAKDLISD